LNADVDKYYVQHILNVCWYAVVSCDISGYGN